MVFQGLARRARFAAMVILAAALAVLPACGHAALIFAVNQADELFSFDSSAPDLTTAPVGITGLTLGDSLIGIDFRPATGDLYAVGRNGTTARVYTVDTTTGAASFASTLDQAIDGTQFGVDFNPVADRLRITSDTTQNLRANVETGATTVDGALAYASGDANFGTTPVVVASAYTNSVAGASSTELYNLDTATLSLVQQFPANDGTLTTIGLLSEFPFLESTFEIDGFTGDGFVVLNGLSLSSINLATGETAFIGNINTGSGIVAISSTIPEPSSLAVLGLMTAGLVARRRR